MQPSEIRPETIIKHGCSKRNIAGKNSFYRRRSLYHPGYSTNPEHLCSTHRHYLDRSPEYYLQKALKISPELHELFRLMFAQKRHPEQVYRSCQGILSLQRKTPEATFKKACSMAMEVEQHTYGFIRNIIKNKMTQTPEVSEKESLPEHRNIRGKDYYKQSTLNFDNNETSMTKIVTKEHV